MTPTDADRERAEEIVAAPLNMPSTHIVLYVDAIALALATVRAEERAACYDAVEAVAMRFRANRAPISEIAADECAAAIRAREGK